MNPELEQLRKSLNPEIRMNVVEQCRIVAQALGAEGDYPNQQLKLSQFLQVSRNKVYKMYKIHLDAIGQMKDWLRTTRYESDMAYKLSTLDPIDQLKFVNLADADKRVFLVKFGKVFQRPEAEEKPTEKPLSSPIDAKV